MLQNKLTYLFVDIVYFVGGDRIEWRSHEGESDSPRRWRARRPLASRVKSNGLLCLSPFEYFSQGAGSFEKWGTSLITRVIISYVGHLD